MPPHIPPLPPRFTAERVLTTSSKATTVLARDRVLDRLVVIKLVDLAHPHDAEAGERFDHEARAAASVNHPNVVSVFDYGSHAGARYLVLRHVEGDSLRAYLDRRGRVGPEEAVRIAGQILAGLGAIHAAGIIHRDIRPETVIVGDDGLLRITNFGVAVTPTERNPSMQALALGAPAYLAPEQTFGYGVTPAADLYAVGVMLFEILTGELPFPLGASPALAFARVATPPAIPDVAPDANVSPQLETVARRALATNPDDRFQTAAEMADALTAAPVWADEPETAPLSPMAAEMPTQPFVPFVEPPPIARPNRPAPWLNVAVPVLVAALIAALVGGAAASHFWRDSGAPPTLARAATSGQPTATTAAKELAAVVDTATVAPTPTEGLHAILAATKLPAAEPSPTPSPTSAPPTATKPPKRKKKATPTSTATSKPDNGAIIAPVATSAAVPISESFSMSDWRGAFVGNQSWYGRPWVAIYGARSQYPQAALAFSLDAAPSGSTTLTLDGLDDEWAGNVAIEISVNGISIFSGPSPFLSWDGQGHGENARWTTYTFEIPAGVLQAGENQITVANLEPAANFGTGPYVLLSDAKLSGL